MKKCMKMMTMALVAVAVMVGFASCGGDDDNNNPSGGQPKKSYSMMKINITLDGDVLSIGDFKIVYLDENGNEKTEDITTSHFTKTIKFNTNPARAKYNVVATLKKDIPNKDKFKISIADKSEAGVYTDEGCMQLMNFLMFSKNTNGIDKNTLPKYFESVFKNWGNDATIKY